MKEHNPECKLVLVPEDEDESEEESDEEYKDDY
jgi:hypothetical protein